MADYRLSAAAETEIDAILVRSEDSFGADARKRYAALFVAAMQDVSEAPQRPSVVWLRVARHRVGLYHIHHSRAHVPDPPGRVGEPRHVIVIRVADDGIVDILGVMHERMLRGRALRRILGIGSPDK
ncbi:MAG: type II toxin-antitoxin system RelE/ParE family toxin [Alphaproteobacteria bacterium]